MARRDLLASALLLAIISIFTAFGSGSGAEPVVAGGFAQYLVPAALTLYLLVVLANCGIIMDLLAAFFLGNKKEQSPGKRSWGVLLGYAMGLVLIFAFLRSEGFLSVLGAVGKAITESTAAFNFTNPLLTSQGSAGPFNLILMYYTVLIFGGVVLVSFTLFFGGLRRAIRWSREDQSPVTARLAARQVVQKAAMNLRLAGNYRETILNCYRQMCEVLSNFGLAIRPEDTANEFSENVSHKLALGSGAVRELTFLFEEARYSQHEITDQQRTASLGHLVNLERLLGTEA